MHDHAPPRGAQHRSRLAWAVGITSAVVVAQVVGGVISGSLALLADAAHMLTDVAALTIALAASFLANRPATSKRTYGWLRVEILAALVNALLLFGAAVFVVTQALGRIGEPVEVEGGPMLVFAVVGAVANAASLVLLRSGSSENINVRGAYLEVFGDLVGSLAVIVAAIVILTTGWMAVDTIAAFLVFALVVPRVVILLRDVIRVLLESTPAHLNLDEVRTHLEGDRMVVAVHDLHAWTITSGTDVLTAHIVVRDATDETCEEPGSYGRVLDRLTECLHEHFELEHITLQLEPQSHQRHEAPSHA